MTLFNTSISVGNNEDEEMEEAEEEEVEEEEEEEEEEVTPVDRACWVASLCARSGVKIASRTRARAASVATKGSNNTPIRDPNTSIGPAIKGYITGKSGGKDGWGKGRVSGLGWVGFVLVSGWCYCWVLLLFVVVVVVVSYCCTSDGGCVSGFIS